MNRFWTVFSLFLAIVLCHGSVCDNHDHDHDEEKNNCLICYVQTNDIDHYAVNFFLPSIFEQIIFLKNNILVSKTDTSVFYLRDPPVNFV